MATKRTLRAVTEDEKPASEAPKLKTIAEALASGDERDLLEAKARVIARAMDSPMTTPTALKSLSIELTSITDRLRALRAEEGEGDIGEATATADEAFDEEAL